MKTINTILLVMLCTTANRAAEPAPEGQTFEYACRAGNSTAYWTGEQLPEAHHRNQWTESADTRVNAKDNALRARKGKVPVTLKVGTMPANCATDFQSVAQIPAATSSSAVRLR